MTIAKMKWLSGCICIASVLLVSTVSLANIIYVNQAAKGKHTGTSWPKAFNNLQAALQAAHPNDQVWIAKGSYYPSTTGDRQASFKIPDNVTVLGGFSGNETSIVQRNYQRNLTILDGDIQHSHTPQTYSQHVVIMGDHAVLDGCVIEHGYNVQIPGSNISTHTTPQAILSSHLEGVGAGIVNARHAGIVKNCIIENNIAMKGAGSYNMVQNAIPVYIHDTFRNNVAVQRGAAMSNDLNTHVIIANSRFIDNRCNGKGGAIYNDFSSTTLILNTLIAGNHADRAAAIGNDGGSQAIIIASKITNNVAQSIGAALYQGSYNVHISDGYNQLTLINSTVSHNHSLSNGPNIFIWGDNRYDFFHSNVAEWPWPAAQHIPARYQSLVAIAMSVSQRDGPSSTQVNALKHYIEPRQRDASGPVPSFRDKNAVVNKQLTFPQRIYFVNANNQSKKKKNGLSWETAYSDLQTAITELTRHGGGQIWIAKGTYYPDINRQTPQSSSFKLGANIAFYGGFSGNETTLSQRNFTKNPVILSGNIGSLLHNRLHSYHVVIGAKHSLIDGVTIEQGQANGRNKNAYGGGLLMIGYNQTVNLKHVIFRNNEAYYGGAIYAFNNVTSYLYDVDMMNNRASMGAGIYLSFGSDIVFNHGTLAHNTARYRGGAVVVNYGSDPIFSSVIFNANSTQGNGGAIWIDDQASQFGGTQAQIIRCQFMNNFAQFRGGAIAAVNKGTLRNEGNIFRDNHAKNDPDVYRETNTGLSASGNITKLTTAGRGD